MPKNKSQLLFDLRLWLAAGLIFTSIILAMRQAPEQAGAAAEQRPPDGLFRQAASQLPAAPAALRSRSVTVDFNQIEKFGDGSHLRLNLFADAMYTAVLDRTESNRSGSITWVGHLEGIGLSDAIFVIRDQTLVGHISLPGRTFSVRYLAGQTHLIIEAGAGAAAPSDDDFRLPSLLKSGERPFVSPVGSDDGSVIDIMVVYSDDVAATNLAIMSEIELAVAYTNQSYINSAVDQRVFLVHAAEINYVETGNLNSDLDAITNVDGNIDQVHTWRNTYHADDVIFLVADDGLVNGCRGLGWVQTNVVPSFQSLAYAAMGDCLTWGTSVFAHEFGHTMGGQHDWYMRATTSPYSYAHGYVDVANQWVTLMAYPNECSDQTVTCSILPYWSNPGVTYFGAPMGTPGGTNTSCTEGNLANPDCDADNHRTLNNTAANTAGFRLSQIVWTGSVSSNWNTAANWIIQEGPAGLLVPTQRVPRFMDDVYIPAVPIGGRFPVINGDRTARNVTIADGAQLTMNGGSLTVLGHWSELGSGRFNGTGGRVTFSGPLPQEVSSGPSSSFPNLQIGDGAGTLTVTLKSDLNVNGSLDIQAGAALSAGSSTLQVAGNWTDYGTGFAAGSSHVILDGAGQLVRTLGGGTLSYALGPEEFEGAFPPSGWTQIDNSGSGNWGRSDSFGASNVTNGTGFSAASKGTATAIPNNLDNELRSPAFTVPATPSWLSYESNFQDWNGNGDAWLDISSDGGSSWSNLTFWTNDRDAGHTPTSETVSLAAYAGQTVTLRWRFVATNTYAGAWYWQIDDVAVSTFAWDGPLNFHDLSISGAPTTFGGDLLAHNNLVISNTGKLDVAAFDIKVDGLVTNQGTISQTRNVPNGVPVAFLHIQDAAAAATKYRGVEITPSSDLGDVTVAVTAVDGPQGEYCTSDEASSPAYAGRCYTVNVTSDGPAVVKLWALDSERNGIAQAELAGYRFLGTWQKLTPVVTGSDGGSYVHAQGNTSGFSSFLLGDANNSPTGAPGSTTVITPGVSLSPASWVSGLNGETIFHTVTVTNTGNVADTFALATGGPWPAEPSVTETTLPPGGSDTIGVSVSIPQSAFGGQLTTTVFTATSTLDPQVNAALTLTTSVTISYSLSLSANSLIQAALPGETVTYTLTLTNSGNVTDSITLAVSGSWTTTLSSLALQLGPGASQTLSVMVVVDSGAAIGASDVATVTANSQGGGKVTAVLTTRAGAPNRRIMLPVILRPAP